MLISRLPIFDRDRNVVGYEAHIQWKRDIHGPCDPLSLIAEQADDFAANGWILVALPVDKILDGSHEVLPRDRTLVQPLMVDSEKLFVQSLSKLKATGYRIAWSAPHGGGPGLEPGVVCLDGRAAQERAFAASVSRAHEDGCRVAARLVDTHEAFGLCRESAVDFFEGRFYCQRSPEPVRLHDDQLAAVKLLTALQSPNVLLREIEELDYFPGQLSSRLLRLADATEGRPIGSLRYAVGAVGIEHIRRWASLLLLSAVEEKPRELCVAAAVRAKMCELLADSDDQQRQSMFFSAGICSVLDALLDRPMPEAAAALPASAELHEALVNGTGVLGATLDAVLSYESADWESIALKPFHPTMIRNVYLEALRWTRGVCIGLGIQKAAHTPIQLVWSA